MKKQIAEWMEIIKNLKSQGRTYVTIEWLTKHRTLGTMRKTHRRNINDITENYLNLSIGLEGFQIV